jgi:streptogramin lyase
MHSSRRRWPWLLSAVLLAAPLVAQEAPKVPENAPASAPESAAPLGPRLMALVMGARWHSQRRESIGGVECSALHSLHRHPKLAWPVREPEQAPFERTHEGVAKWLTSTRATWGLERFELVFREAGSWRGEDVWRYAVQHSGIDVLDATIDVHFEGARFAAVQALLPGDFGAVEAPPAERGEREWVYVARTEAPRADLELAWLARDTTEQGERVRVLGPQGLRWTRITPAVQTSLAAPVITKWNVPSGNFPDQLGFDPRGDLWFSQPNQARVGKLVPATGQFSFVNTGSGSIPDGLMCDANGRVWTGTYSAVGLVRVNSVTNVHASFPAPYSPSSLAIPFLSANGKLYITDHGYNRVAVFDPATNTWGSSFTMLVPGAWVVAGTEDVQSQALYFTQYFANSLARITWSGVQTDLPVPTAAGPAFDGYLDGKVWYSLWSSARFGCYDVASGQFVEYLFPAGFNFEVGGPMATRRDGKVVIGTRNIGYLMVLDTQTHSVRPVAIGGAPGLKDGLIIGPGGAVWFTESGANKISRFQM